MLWTKTSFVLARKRIDKPREANSPFRWTLSWQVELDGSHAKNISSCFPNLQRGIRTFTSIVAGSGPERARIEGRASELGVDARVRLLGTILDRACFYNAIDAFVLPSIYEGLPMAVLEAMSSGVPVLSSRLEGISAVLMEEKEGLLARPGDVEDFSKQLRRLKESPELRRQLTTAARAKALDQFSASVTAGKIENIYRRELAMANTKTTDKSSVS